MQIFLRIFAIILISLALPALVSCSESPKPDEPKDPLITERDSLLTVYGAQIDAKELEYLRLYEHGISQNTYLYGKTRGQFWMGLFASPNQKTAEYLLDLDPESVIPSAYYTPASHSYQASGFELIQIHGQEKSNQAADAPVSKSILRILLNTYELKSHTSYLPKNEGMLMEFARRWKGGFLLEHTRIVSAYGKNTTQYLSTDLKESIVWDCRAPSSPRSNILHIEVDFYLKVETNSIGGFDYSACTSWTINTLDFFNFSSCEGCTTSLKLLNQIGENITVEVRVNEETRHALIVYRSGKLISNEVVE
ncbi:hypothetical protein J2X69_004001 [Algoriphagus sp. 4150]|uniref:hypothetical protein n=1 Tax=Algoriphagus sp. 4150 TaxID=2817756 RepID=UPI00285D3B50|nr:hypothetical protein [Algoriphagus sp. 4150]MDR7131637.1 hypothetical protein [Algoriphagus sp. 4150]